MLQVYKVYIGSTQTLNNRVSLHKSNIKETVTRKMFQNTFTNAVMNV